MKVHFTPMYKMTNILDSSTVGDEYVASKPFDQESIFYDIKARNKKIIKPAPSNFDPFNF